MVEAGFKVLASGIDGLSFWPGRPAASHRAAKSAILLHVSTLGGVSAFANIGLYFEAALLAWLDERTERGFEVSSDQLASGFVVLGFCVCFFPCSAWACVALLFGFPVSLGSPPGGHLRVLQPGPAGVTGLGTITGLVIGASFGRGFGTVAQYALQGH